MNERPWRVGYVIDFADGKAERYILHEGTEAECRNAAAALQIYYAGQKLVNRVTVLVEPKPDDPPISAI